jgi:small-conductance mechanosensitive channel
MTPHDWTLLAVVGGVALVLVLLGPVVQFVLHRRGRTAIARDVRRLRWPIRGLALAVIVSGAGKAFDRPWALDVARAMYVVTIAWLIIGALHVVQAVVFRRLDIDRFDNLRARSRRTQIELVRRVASVIVIIGAAIVLLLTLAPLDGIGETIVAYAGLIGVVLGFALRAPIENLAAGMIVAFAEPIRIDDVVVVEGEWGRIEHIGLVNVSVRIWDDRRLVLPTSRFVNEPFENWTRSSSQVTGTVTAWLDHTADIDALRAEIGHQLERSELWDGRFFVVQVVELGERAMQVRVLVTARNAGELWDLRCELREALLPHLSANVDALPVVRLRDDADDRELVGA